LRIASVAGLLVLAFPAGAGAADINVTTFADEAMPNATCSLREAVTAANDNTSTHEDDCTAGTGAGIPDNVILQAGTYTLAGPAGEDSNAGGDLDIEAGGDKLFITGTADANGVPTTIIDAGNVDRILDLQPDAGQVRVSPSKVTLRNGNAPGSPPAGDGGAVRIQDPDALFRTNMVKILNSDAGHYGGGIFFDGGDVSSTIELRQTELAGNSAGSEGGGIWVDQHYGGIFDVRESSVVGNSADMGGGIYLGTRAMNSVQLDMFNSTVSGNTASMAGGGVAFDLDDSGNFFANFSTIANNTSTPAGSGGGIYTSDTQFVNIGQSIVAGNTAGGVPSNCVGPGNFQTEGYNIESTNSCGFNTGAPPFTDLVNTDPLLAPLAVYPASASALQPLGAAPPPGQLTTRTRALYVGSPAINRIPRTPADNCADAGLPTAYDQRFVLRPSIASGGLCDVGAFEGSIPKPAGGPIVKCGGKTATKVGTAGRDRLVGTKKADVIAGLGGNDTIKGKGGKDILCGGKGKDKLIGGKGKDKLLGQAGRDRLRGGPGRDKLKGGPGRDRQVQ
jgi:CSLREA domain-containing protein